jgi:hypothetical protein
MIKKGSAPTSIELVVLGRIIRKQDPWGGVHGVGSRLASSAIGRLRKRGFVDYGYRGESEPEYFATADGFGAWNDYHNILADKR